MDLPEQEEKILKFWEKEKIFEKSLEKTKDGENFVFYDGPITVNAKPGIHHVLSRIFKDIIPRFKTMQGYYVRRKNGWDTHGLPVELEVEKDLDFNTKKEIEDYGVDKFNKKCKGKVDSYIPYFKKFTKRIGYWANVENPYITYDASYIESLWWILKQVWDKGLLYRDRKVVPYCPRCGTSLSSHEVAQGYKEVTEPAVFVKFPIKNTHKTTWSSGQGQLKKLNSNIKYQISNIKCYLLAWTTTPWTLPGNVALAVNPELTYVAIKEKGGKECFILAKKRLEVIKEEYEIVAEFKGTKLVGTEYEPLFKVAPIQEDKNSANAYQVYAADFVDAEEGTGIVHTASMYGVEDYKLGKKVGLPQHHTVDKQGKFKKDLGKADFLKKLEGQFVKKADPEIIKELKLRKLLYKEENYTHEYPFCWRCKTPLLYYATESWFIKVSRLQGKLLKNNQDINWLPAHLKQGRFGEWLREVKDWTLSRKRFWGTPLPVWECTQCNHQQCIGSYQKLKKQALNFDQVYNSKEKIDPHRPYIDKIKLECPKCGKEMTRVPYVIDVWFDSGAMPFAQNHYPFENEKSIDGGEQFPADYISEAIDQTRGWFYTLLAVSTLLGKGAPFKNVLCLGLVLDKKGEKMSKSKGNIVKPFEQIEKYGIDPVRWFFYTVNKPSENKKYDEKELKNHLRRLFFTLGNSVRFLKMYAPDEATLNKKEGKANSILDRWLSSRINTIIQKTTFDLEKFRITKAARRLEDFTDELSNAYIRFSRDRFQNPDSEARLTQASNLLASTILRLIHLLAPFCPFYAESLYQGLKENFKLAGKPSESIHLSQWPEYDQEKIDKNLEQKFQSVLEIISLGLKKRRGAGIKVRQPLASVKIKAPIKLKEEFRKLIKQELNVKSISFKLTNGAPQLAYDTKLTPRLKMEGTAREIIRQVQSLRKKLKLTPKDQITVYVEKTEFLQKIIKRWGQEIKTQTRARKVETTTKNKLGKTDVKKKLDADGKKFLVGIKK